MKHPTFCMTTVFLVLVSLLALGRVAAHAAQPQPTEEDKALTVKLVLHPAAESRPALKYQLLPSVLDRRPGNAAVIYNKIALYHKDLEKVQEKIVEWLDMPLDKLPRKEVSKVLAQYRNVLEDLDLAARRENCDWELSLRERDFVSILLPELQETRKFGRLLALQARLQILDREFDQAIRTLQTGYALAQHVSRGPTLINGLVGIAIAKMMSQRVQELPQQPGAPSLYWAVTMLPQPLVDLRPGIETELNMLFLSYPELRQLDDTQHSPEYWQKFMATWTKRVAAWRGLNGGDVQGTTTQAQLLATAMAIKGYPMAKQYLIEHGRSREAVEAMPVPQVVAIYTMETYIYYRDEIFKWFYVPYAEGRSGAQRGENKLMEEARQREIIPLASLLLPALWHAKRAAAISERGIAVLRVVEAIRLYGTAHDGRLPAKLSDITQVPVPSDPTTGQAFVYSLRGDTAVLESPAPPGTRAKDNAVRLEIKLAK